jgi:hypothetical protein
VKILNITPEWRIAVDNNDNYMPERYVVKPAHTNDKNVDVPASAEWVRQGAYTANTLQAATWIATKLNHEGSDQNVIDSMNQITDDIRGIMSVISDLK